MPDQSMHYKLTKPLPTEAYDIGVVNDNTDAVDAALHELEVNKVPNTRTVNGHALSSNVILTPADVGAVPTSRTVNGHALSSNVTLTAEDVGAAGQGIHGPYDLPLVAGVTGDARYWYTDTGLVLAAVSVAISSTDTYKTIASIPAGFRPSGYAYSIILQDTNADFPHPAARQLYIRPNGAELRTVSDDNTNQSYAGSIVYAVEV